MEDLLNTKKTTHFITREEIPDIFGIQEHKVVILAVVESAKENDFPVTRTCGFGSISRRHAVVWRWKQRNDLSLENLKPGPRKLVHKLLHR